MKDSSQDSIDDIDKKNGLAEEDGLPQHLPKKQRELFLRIQQQQREAENSQVMLVYYLCTLYTRK